MSASIDGGRADDNSVRPTTAGGGGALNEERGGKERTWSGSPGSIEGAYDITLRIEQEAIDAI